MKMTVTDQTKFEYSPLGMALNEALKKMRLKVLVRVRVISFMIATTSCLRSTKVLMSTL